MRLLHTATLRLRSFPSSESAALPSYAALSHTWGKEADEVHFHDIRDESRPLPEHKAGFQKLRGGCRQAQLDGYDFIWIDTCCIDKTSSAELSEAINSMFAWYRQADTCYAYLEDVVKADANQPLHRSRWFTRGWTLQELIAPPDVVFYDSAWKKLGQRNHMASQALLTEITGISGTVLNRTSLEACSAAAGQHAHHRLRGGRCVAPGCHGEPDALGRILGDYSAAQKMSWLSRRTTTRVEDLAYCLLGLFDVNMPLLYGEGGKAFVRLQEEIIKKSDDQSILAHGILLPRRPADQASASNLRTGSPHLLAASPSAFATAADIIGTEQVMQQLGIHSRHPRSPIILNPKWITISMYTCPCRPDRSGSSDDYWIGILDCGYADDCVSRPGLVLSAVGPHEKTYARVGNIGLLRLDPSPAQGFFPIATDHGSLTLKYDLGNAVFETVHLLLAGPEKHTRPRASSVDFVTPPLRLTVRVDGLGCRTAYPLADRAAFNPAYLAPVKKQWSAIQPNPLLCGIVCLARKEERSRPMFVLWGLRQASAVPMPWEIRVELSQGSPWCRIVQWQDVMGDTCWPGAMTADLQTQFGDRAEAIMRSYNNTSSKLRTDIAAPFKTLPVDSVHSTWSASALTEEAREAVGVQFSVKLKEALFLGRLLYEFEVSVA
ncbi:Heterokaryon incompatibility [Niveomyces insectorum RCEF 264]|uniref:Heterokaryon incompatibility n=1 Tax=Niveomyces insectorum RCEF 264 TaxID=1081102 RepID=A0A162ML80_9HYPO|nr:Heterokaryon incompatibility [Niveomyces insectorum RCEF 264]